MALLQYFHRTDSRTTKEVKERPEASPSVVTKSISDQKKQRGCYLKFTPSEKVEIAKYASEHGVARACQHYKGRNVKKTSVIDWRNAYERELKKQVAGTKPGEAVSVTSLPGKKGVGHLFLAQSWMNNFKLK